MNKYLIPEEEIELIDLWNRRYFETTEYFISTFQKRINKDVSTLPECTVLDSLERHLEMYETAYMNFTIHSKKELKQKYRESLQDLVELYDEGLIYPTKRKVEYLKELISKHGKNSSEGIIKVKFDNSKKDSAIQNQKNKISSDRELELLFSYRGNIDFFGELKTFHEKAYELQNLNFGETGRDKVSSEMALQGLNIVFSSFEAVYLFQKQPFNCLNWIKHILKNLSYEYAEKIKSIILKGLKDKRRFGDYSSNLSYIHDELNNFDCSTLNDAPNVDCEMFEYFKVNQTDFLKKNVDAFITVRGFKKTESEIVREFIKKHKSEIINQMEVSSFETENNNGKVSEYSADDYSFIFYYLENFIANKEGTLIERIKEFLKKYEVKTKGGKTPSSHSFRNNYYNARNRINGKENEFGELTPPDKATATIKKLKKISNYFVELPSIRESINRDISRLQNT